MIANAARLVASALGRSWRVDTRGAARLDALRRGGTPFLFAVWHRELLPLLWYHRGGPTTIVASSHRDGRYLSDAALRWGYGVVEGSSTRGGAEALRRVVRILEGGGEVAMAVDGPRGPRDVAKPGIVVAAGLAGVPILPVVAVPRSAWTVNSWDRFLIPRPFTRVTIAYGAPLHVASNARRERARVLEALEGRFRVTRREVAA